MKATIVVDKAALNQGIFKDRGGIQRASKRFDYQVLTVLNRFKKALFS